MLISALTLSALLSSTAEAGVVRVAEPAGLAATNRPRRIALVIGVDTYDDPTLVHLRYAAKDAADMARVLEDPKSGAFDEVVLLNGRITVDEVRGAFQNLTARLADEDTFVMYFAGHGTLSIDVEGSNQYMLMSGSHLDDARRTGLSVALVQDAIETLPAHQRVLIIDACYNGTGRSALPEATVARLRTLRGNLPPPAARQVSRYDAYLYAAHLNQAAMEDPELGNGVYTHYLVEALQGPADIDGDGLIDVVEAHQYARDHTLTHTGGAQVPWLQSTLVGRASIFMAGSPTQRTAAERSILAGLDDLPTGTMLSVDGQSRGEGAVEAGKHRVELTLDGETIVSTNVRLKPGERVHVGNLLEDRGAQTLVGIGAGWVDSGSRQDRLGLSANGTLHLAGWYFPKDQGGSRPGLSARTSFGLGPVEDFEYFPTGDAAAGMTWVWGRTFKLGPSLGGGLLWRAPETGLQVGFFVEPGLHLHVATGAFFAGLDVGLTIFPASVDQRAYRLASVRPTLGTRF